MTSSFATFSTFSGRPDDSGCGASEVGGCAVSTDSPSDGPRVVPTMPCRACAVDVPAGAFCGYCGAYRSGRGGDGPDWLRIRAYAAAPKEHVLRLSVVSSLFPHLAHRSRAPFRVGLAALLLAVVVLALLRWQAPLIAVSALGLPLLLYIYLREIDGYHDLPIRMSLLGAVLGVGLGAGWALLSGEFVARSCGVAVGVGVSGDRILRNGLAIPLSGAVLMLVPAVLVRASGPRNRESLDGFLIGSLGAIGFTAASTLTRLAPQLATGLMARDRPVGGLVVEAGIQGVVMPLTAAAAGGMVGAALWFTRRAGTPHRHRGPGPLLSAVVVVLAVYAGLGLVDVAPLSQYLQLGLRLVITVWALLTLRIVLHLALLHEPHDMSSGAPWLCAECTHIVPEMAFCPNCGIAARASSRSSRTARRVARPVPTDATSDGR